MIRIEFYNVKKEKVNEEWYDNQDAAYALLKIRDWEQKEEDNYAVTIL